MLRLISSEWLKIRRSILWLLALASPLLAALGGLIDGVPEGGGGVESAEWIAALGLMSVLHALLFLPLLTGIFAAMLCRYEHIGGGWKQLLALPVSRTQVYGVKLLFIMSLLAVTQAIFLATLLAVGLALGFEGPIPWEIIAGSVVGGWLACLPLAALQLAVSVAWASFAAPLAINVIFTLPNLLIANSETYGPFYPWAQPLLAMMPHGEFGYGAFQLSAVTLFGVILGSFAVFLLGGWAYWMRKAI
jgi:lantibiotic transport system permease protein